MSCLLYTSLVENGFVYTGWHDVDFKDYVAQAYFDPANQGAAVTGYQEIDGKKYLFYENGAAASGSGALQYGCLLYTSSYTAGEGDSREKDWLVGWTNAALCQLCGALCGF